MPQFRFSHLSLPLRHKITDEIATSPEKNSCPTPERHQNRHALQQPHSSDASPAVLQPSSHPTNHNTIPYVNRPLQTTPVITEAQHMHMQHTICSLTAKLNNNYQNCGCSLQCAPPPLLFPAVHPRHPSFKGDPSRCTPSTKSNAISRLAAAARE